jgi:hypothetical protein
VVAHWRSLSSIKYPQQIDHSTKQQGYRRISYKK